jgi:hypothetical protein
MASSTHEVSDTSLKTKSSTMKTPEGTISNNQQETTDHSKIEFIMKNPNSNLSVDKDIFVPKQFLDEDDIKVHEKTPNSTSDRLELADVTLHTPQNKSVSPETHYTSSGTPYVGGGSTPFQPTSDYLQDDISRGTEKGSKANSFGHFDDKLEMWKQLYKYDPRKDPGNVTPLASQSSIQHIVKDLATPLYVHNSMILNHQSVRNSQHIPPIFSIITDIDGQTYKSGLQAIMKEQDTFQMQQQSECEKQRTIQEQQRTEQEKFRYEQEKEKTKQQQEKTKQMQMQQNQCCIIL